MAPDSTPRPRAARTVLALAVLTLAASVGCAGLKPPVLQVEHLGVGKVRVTGASLRVAFHAQNPNPQPLHIARFEYELKLNGRRLGRGYHAEPVDLPGFGSERIESHFDLNFLSLPRGIQRVLDQDRVKASVKGHFYVADGGHLRKLGFSSDAEVRLEH
jgi:LEA14-like dessication related protein